MADRTSVSNMALLHLGATEEIQNVNTENSEAAIACRRFFDPALKMFQRDFSWPFSNVIQALALVEESPNTEWAFSYQYPSDCEFFHRILSGTRNDSRQTRVPYRVARGTSGSVIFTDKEDAFGDWSVVETDLNRYPPDAIMALSFLIAHLISPKITSGDPFKLGARAFALYNQARNSAQANALNEQQDDEPTQSEFIAGRDS